VPQAAPDMVRTAPAVEQEEPVVIAEETEEEIAARIAEEERIAAIENARLKVVIISSEVRNYHGANMSCTAGISFFCDR